MKSDPRPQRLRRLIAGLKLKEKVLFAFLALSLLPLIVLIIISSRSIQSVESQLRQSATAALDAQAVNALELRAVMVANEVGRFLQSVEADLHDLALLPPTAANYLRFSRNHRRQIWFRAGTNQLPVERHESIPLYSELTFIGPDGRERLRIVDGRVAEELRQVSAPSKTTYRSETYFRDASKLPPGKIVVSHLTGWHVSRAEQLGTAASPEEAVEGSSYRGVIRFAAPVHDSSKRLLGVVVLSLDHRHLMEFTQHIISTEKNFIVFPSYADGSYAFMFDDEGWIITHPKYWDIRGLDRDGRLVPPYTAESSPADIAAGRIPYNLFYAGFIHPNYPVVAAAVLAGRSGVVDVTNVGGSQKIMAYAPIFYAGGTYEKGGIFGGITIGAELAAFHRPAQEASARIRKEFTRFSSQSWFLIAATAIVVFIAAYRLARGIADPLRNLIASTKEMARGNLEPELAVTSHDEVGELTESFTAMARELDERRRRFLRSVEALRRSRREILRERNFKETVFENIETGILTLDAENRVTSANGPARRLLQLSVGGVEKLPLREVLAKWPEILQALQEGPQMTVGEGRWSRYVNTERDGRLLNFRLALLPLTAGGAGWRLMAIEDITERVMLRQQMARMERLASLGRLAAGIAHEVRNPLTGVSLLLDELHDRLLANPTDQALIRRALQEIERLEGLVNELLDFAALPRPSLSPGDLGSILGDSLLLIRKQAERSGVTLVTDLPATFPLRALDANRLEQALLNLFNNALEAMPQGGVLTVAAEIASDEIILRVGDTGAGIAAERLALIFEPFFTSKARGTGLGLSITHNIVSEHGGRIEVESRPGAGSIFTLHFPLDPANDH